MHLSDHNWYNTVFVVLTVYKVCMGVRAMRGQRNYTIADLSPQISFPSIPAVPAKMVFMPIPVPDVQQFLHRIWTRYTKAGAVICIATVVDACAQVFAFERTCWWIHFSLLHLHCKRQIELHSHGSPT